MDSSRHVNRNKDISAAPLAVFLIFLNIGIFFYVNTFPMRSLNREVLFHNFVWAADGFKDLTTLKSGLRFSDFLKPFLSEYVDGVFRTRQVSYLVEMLSFKFWQFIGADLIRNYTLIGMHILNAVLVYILLLALTKKKWVAWTSSLLLLNSGIALATLLFPFRNAKILVMTFILLAWIVAAGTPGKLCEAKQSRIWLFFVLIFLACFTDETAFFLCPIILIYLYLRDGRAGVFSKRLIQPALAMGLVFILCAVGFLMAAVRLAPRDALIGPLHHISGVWQSCYAGGQFIIDLPQSFFFYFLRRNFGYWDLTLYGILAAAAFLLFMFLLWKGSSKANRRLSLAIGAALLFKALVLAHNGGLHKIIMPETAEFPSLFYFSYYYVYAEAVIFAVVLGLLMDGETVSDKKALVYLSLAGLMALSNALHLREGPRDALVFHQWNEPARIAMLDDMHALKKLIQNKQYWPLYASFPSVDQPFMQGKEIDQTVPFYVKPILILFLTELESSQLVISLNNVKPELPFAFKDELLNANYFYDIRTRQLIGLQGIRGTKGQDSLKPYRVPPGQPTARLQYELKADERKFLLFVKGKASLDLKIDQRPLAQVFQVYGYSYQAFQFTVGVPDPNSSHQLNVVIHPADADQEVSIVGPLGFPE